MKYKTIKIEDKEYYLIPKTEHRIEKIHDVCIKVTRIEHKTEVHVDAIGLWAEDTSSKDKNVTYVRIEKEDGSFEWNRTCGGYVSARKEDVAILEPWYQRTLR